MRASEALSETIAELLRDDPRRVLLGEDVRDGGMLGLSRAAAEDEELQGRILASPLTSSAGVAHAGGLALGGSLPIVLLPSVSVLVEGLAALRELAALPWRSGGRSSLPVLFVAPSGPGFGLGGSNATSEETLLAAVPGLRVFCPSRAEDLCAWMRAAADFEAGEEPTVLLVPRSLFLAEIDEPTDALSQAPTNVRELRSGGEVTVLTWGDAVEPALLAADASGRAVGVIDLACLAPLDVDGIVAAASETGKVVVAHGGPRAHGLGAEVAALVSDRCILSLDAPVVRVCGAPGLYGPHDEWLGLPTASEIAEAIVSAANY